MKLLEIVAGFLSNSNNSSKEEGLIIASALNLWAASVVLKNDLLKHFFSWTRAVTGEEKNSVKITNATDFILNGIYSPKSLFVRNSFKECIELICEKFVPSNDQEQPLFFTIKILMKNFPSPSSKISTIKSSEYFTLFGALIKQFTDLVEKKPELIESV